MVSRTDSYSSRALGRALGFSRLQAATKSRIPAGQSFGTSRGLQSHASQLIRISIQS